MRSIVLCLALSVVIAIPALADVASVDASCSAGAEVQLIRDSELGTSHVQVSLKRTDLSEVTVRIYDKDGVALGTYSLYPHEAGGFRSELSIVFSPELSAKVDSARVIGFTSQAPGQKDQIFNTGLLGATRMSCAGLCNPTRIQCSFNCSQRNCTGSTYSCTEASGCEAICTCTGCP
jgi:hypothetical protein